MIKPQKPPGRAYMRCIPLFAIVHNISTTPQLEGLMMMMVFVPFGLARRSKPAVGLQVRKVVLSMFLTNIYF